MSHMTASSVLTEKIYSTKKNMNVSALTSKGSKIQKYKLAVGSYGIPSTVVQLKCLT